MVIWPPYKFGPSLCPRGPSRRGLPYAPCARYAVAPQHPVRWVCACTSAGGDGERGGGCQARRRTRRAHCGQHFAPRPLLPQRRQGCASLRSAVNCAPQASRTRDGAPRARHVAVASFGRGTTSHSGACSALPSAPARQIRADRASAGEPAATRRVSRLDGSQMHPPLTLPQPSCGCRLFHARVLAPRPARGPCVGAGRLRCRRRRHGDRQRAGSRRRAAAQADAEGVHASVREASPPARC